MSMAEGVARPGKRLAFVLPLVVFLVLVVYFGIGLTKDPRRLPSVLIDQPVPEFDLPAIEDREHGFASRDLPGRVSLVNVFGSWCVACRVEHPLLMRLKADGAVPIHGIDWREPDGEAGPRWLARYGDPYTLVGDDPESRGAIAFGVTGAPETFVVDRNGVIRYKHVGPISEDAWRTTLRPLIEELRRR